MCFPATALGLSTAICLATLPSVALGSTGEQAAVTGLDTLVVTGTRTPRPVLDTPVRTEVVSREEMARTHARSLGDALENVPGIQLREIHGKPGESVSLQGLGGNQVLVLVDGLPVSASTGSTVDVTQLALTEVEHVEIVKGATSAQHGSAAMGGVINVITRDVQPGLSGMVQGDLGTYGDQNPSGRSVDAARRRGSARMDAGTDALRLRVAADRRETDGVDPDTSSWGQPADAVDRDQIDARAEWHPSPAGRFYLHGSRFQEDSESRYLRQLPGQQIRQRGVEDVRRDRVTAGGRWGWDNGAGIQINGMTERFRSDTLKHAGGTSFDDRRAKLDQDHVTLQADLPPVDNHFLQVGGDLRRETLSQTKDGISELEGTGGVSRGSDELYVQDDIFLGSTVELLLGLRFQDDSDFGSHTAGKANLRWHALRTADWHGTLRLGWGQGYRVPDLKERHYRFDHSQLGYVVLGNPDLEPEASDSYQLGWSMDWRQQAWFEVNLFHNRLRNLIQVDSGNATIRGDGVQEFRYANVDRAITQGVETVANVRVSPTLELNTGYTFTDTEDRESGRELTRQPRHQGRFGINWQTSDRIDVNLRARYQSSEQVDSEHDDSRSPGWTTVDVGMNLRATPRLHLFGGVDNVFDTQRDFGDPDDFRPVTGAFAYLGARYEFGGAH
ncbi:outer membrane receptor for ferrienterochelin and colicins [Aquisalimonas asiatica]|uniref:Outer membrane receptor for ferrienterochelin and colicins n=1 Tax=Aquisalimonas asiatica TaxID=406100 RepID=A0A1H8SXS9_9GAMM|nr:outer membrane receptor for ferrienterochelin and colicins [Aquisalimonas asiatica]